jgi:hypothetical protein
MEHDKYAIYILWTVAIVGVVSLIAVFSVGNGDNNLSETDLAGQATGIQIGDCYDSDGGWNLDEYGYVEVPREYGNGYDTLYDMCSNGNQIYENWCNNAGEAEWGIYTCHETCAHGACAECNVNADCDNDVPWCLYGDCVECRNSYMCEAGESCINNVCYSLTPELAIEPLDQDLGPKLSRN